MNAKQDTELDITIKYETVLDEYHSNTTLSHFHSTQVRMLTEIQPVLQDAKRI